MAGSRMIMKKAKAACESFAQAIWGDPAITVPTFMA
jgi:hypothetical protein